MKSEALLNEVLRVLEDKKGHQITALNLQGISLLADYFVICHGNSVPQVQTLASEVRKKAGELGVNIRGIEGYEAARWVLIDLGDVVVHIFHKDEREYYNIERLWSDAKVVELA
jgi:ribosome-associated protein